MLRYAVVVANAVFTCVTRFVSVDLDVIRDVSRPVLNTETVARFVANRVLNAVVVLKTVENEVV